MNNKEFIMNRIEYKEYYESISQFKLGDRVLVVKAFPSGYKGWDNKWVDIMNHCIGEVGTIVALDMVNRRGVMISFDGINNLSVYRFPPYSLKKI